MSMVPSGRHLEISGTGSGESVHRTSIRELRGDRGSRYMVGIEWTGGLALGVLGFNFCNRLDARYAGHPGERHGVRDYHHGQKEKGSHAGQLGGASWVEHGLVDVETW